MSGLTQCLDFCTFVFGEVFSFWSWFSSDEQCDMVEMVLRNEYGDAISACTLNDIFEYDRDYIANIVGYASFRDLLESDDE